MQRDSNPPTGDMPPLLSASRPPWLKVVGRILGAAIVAVCLYYLGRRLVDGVRQVPLSTLKPQTWPLMVSLALTIICVGLGGWSWRLVLRAFGHVLSLRSCLIIQTTSNLAKYVPGYAWQLLGKGYLTRREGVPTGVVAYAALLELGLLLLTGVAVSLSVMPSNMALPGIGALSASVRTLLAVAAWLLAAAMPLVLKSVGRWQRRWHWIVPVVQPAALWGSLSALTLSWLLFGVAFGYLARAFQPLTVADWLLSIYALVTSFLVSLIALFVPAGLGVRESIMTATLGDSLPGGLSVVVALLSRLSLTASELVAFVLARLWLSIARHHDNESITRKG